MAIVSMKRVTVIGHHTLREQVLNELQRLGVMHVTGLPDESASSGSQDDPALSSYDTSRDVSALEQQLAKLNSVLDLIDRFHKIKKSFIDQFANLKVIMSEDEYRRYTSSRDSAVAGLYAQARDLEERLGRISSEEARLRGELALFSDWALLDACVSDVSDTRTCRVSLGQVEARTWEDLVRDLDTRTFDVYVEEISRDKNTVNVLLICHADDYQEASEVLRGYGFARTTLPAVPRTPAQQVRVLEEGLDALAAERAKALEEVAALARRRAEIYALYDDIARDRDKLLAASSSAMTAAAFVLEGWVKAQELERLTKALDRISDDIVVEARDPRDDEEFPVEIENPGVVQPFEVVTKVSGLPAPRALDPTGYLAPFFWVFFGLCLTDAVYGVALIAAGFWLIKRTRAVGMGKNLLLLLAAGGVSTLLAGAVFGGWAGDLGARLLGIGPLWFDPMKEPLKMLMLSFALGVIHVFVGVGIKLYDNVRKGNLFAGLADQGLWLVFLAGLVLLLVGSGTGMAGVAQTGKYLAGVGAVGLVLTQGRHHKNPIKRLGSGILSLYSVTGYMSDVLSYSRLLALGLATGVIGMVLNDMAFRMMGNVVGLVLGIVVLVFGHVFNLLINVVGAYVHSSRLQYVEFFSKFFEGGGKRFVPLAIRNRFVEIHAQKEA